MIISDMLFCGTNICKVSEKSVVSIFMAEESDVRVKSVNMNGVTSHFILHAETNSEMLFPLQVTYSAKQDVN